MDTARLEHLFESRAKDVLPSKVNAPSTQVERGGNQSSRVLTTGAVCGSFPTHVGKARQREEQGLV